MEQDFNNIDIRVLYEVIIKMTMRIDYQMLGKLTVVSDQFQEYFFLSVFYVCLLFKFLS